MKKKRRLMVSALIALTVFIIFGGVAYSADTEYVGHVTLVEGYALPTYTGCHALVTLNPPLNSPTAMTAPNKVVAILTTEQRLQSLFETALMTGNLIHFWGQKDTKPIAPRGGTWSVEVYKTTGVILYNIK